MNKRRVFVYISVVTVIAAFVLFYKLGSLPDKVSLDETRSGFFSASLADSPYIPYYVKFDGYRDSHPTLFLYSNLFFLKFLGTTSFALRFAVAFYGLLTVVVFFFLLMEIITPEAALLGAIFLTFQYKFIAFSRWTNDTSLYFFFLTLSLLFFVKIYKRERDRRPSLRDYFFLGLCLGLLQHAYGSGRVFLPSILTLFSIVLFSYKRNYADLIKKTLFFLIPLGLVLYPLMMAFKNLPPGTFDSSSVELSIYSQNSTLKDKIWAIKHATLRTLGMFNFKGSWETCYSYAGSLFLDPLTGLLFPLGLILGLGVVSRGLYFSFLFLFFVSLIPSFLSLASATPHEVRASGAIIFTTLFSVLSVYRLTNLIKSRFIKVMIVSSVIFFVTAYNLESYYIIQMLGKDTCYWYDRDQLKNSVDAYYKMKPKTFVIFNPWY